jgi:hypothetical protein
MPHHAGVSVIHLPFKKFDVTLKLQAAATVSRFLAATIRGGFGITLHQKNHHEVEWIGWES